jgi:hypothetical protein
VILKKEKEKENARTWWQGKDVSGNIVRYADVYTCMIKYVKVITRQLIFYFESKYKGTKLFGKTIHIPLWQHVLLPPSQEA